MTRKLIYSLLPLFLLLAYVVVPAPAFALSGVGGACTLDSDCEGVYKCGPNHTCVVDTQLDCTPACGTGFTCNQATGLCVSNTGGVLCGSTHCAVGQTCGTGNVCTWAPAGGGSGSTTSSGLTNPLNNITDLPSLLTAVLGAVVKLGGVFLTLMLVFVGFKFVAAQGNAEQLKSAREMLIWTVIGGLILLGAQAISMVIQSTVQSL